MIGEDTAVLQLAHTTFVWAAEVPCLDGAPDHSGVPASLALVRAFASDGPAGSALQLRYEAPGPDGPKVPLLLGRARTEEDVEVLARLVALTLPVTHGLRRLAADELRERMIPFDLESLSARHVAEIRRVADIAEDGRPALVPWPTVPTDGDLASLLARSPGGTMLCLHLERSAIGEDLVAQLHGTVRDLRDDLDATSDPVRQRSLAAHRVWIRELPLAAVELRVTVLAAEPIAPGLPDLVGLAIAGATPGEAGVTFETVRPSSRQELDLAVQLVDDVRCGRWGGIDDAELDALRPMFTAVEAAAAFRLPAAGAVAPVDGPMVSFAAVRDRLLRSSSEPGSDGFLVIDAGRGDYVDVADEIERSTGRPVRRLRLDVGADGFDPFAVPAGAGRTGHAARVLAAFELAHGWSDRSPVSALVLARAVYDGYQLSAPGAPDVHALVDAAGAAFDRLASGAGPDGQRAELLARLSLLDAGPLGSLLTPGAPIDWFALTAEPTVVELGAISGPAERRLLVGLLLAGFLSWREATPLAPGARHLLAVGGDQRLGDLLDASGHAGTAPLADAITAVAGSGQSVLVVAPRHPALHGVLPAPDGWSLPTSPDGTAIALAAADGLPLHGSLVSPGVGS